MDELPSVILDVHMVYAKYSDLISDKSTYLTSDGYRMIELGYLIAHRKIWIEITFAIENTLFHHIRSHGMTRSNSEIDDS